MAHCRKVGVALAVGIFAAGVRITPAQVTPAPAATNPAIPSLILVGNADSAVGPALRQLFDPSRINVIDRSAAGAGVRSAADGGSWAATLALIRPGDFVLIQFGRTLGTAAEGDSLPGVSDDERAVAQTSGTPADTVVHTYGWYLRRYAVEAITRGATPILCAPLLPDAAEQTRDGEWTKAIAVQQRLPFADAAAAAAAAGGGGRPDRAAPGIVAALLGLPSDPLSGYFSATGKAVPAYRPPPPPAPAIAPL